MSLGPSLFVKLFTIYILLPMFKSLRFYFADANGYYISTVADFNYYYNLFSLLITNFIQLGLWGFGVAGGGTCTCRFDGVDVVVDEVADGGTCTCSWFDGVDVVVDEDDVDGKNDVDADDDAHLIV